MKNLSDVIKPLLAIVIVILTFAYFFAISFLPHSVDPQVIIAIVGMNSMAIGYYFGSSSGAAKKDDTIANMANTSQTTTTVTQDEVTVKPTEKK